MPTACAPLDSPIGRLWATVSSHGLVEVTRGELPPAGIPRDDTACAAAVRELADYFAGRATTFSLDLDLAGATPFDAAVWRAVREIPFGETASYSEVAIMAGHPGAARAVGGSMARCPFFPVVPCHRVIRADGSIGGWGSATWVKHWMIDHEA